MLAELAAALRRTPDRPALLGTSPAGRARVLSSRGELVALADEYAHALYARGLRGGDTLAVAVRPGGRALAVLLAAHRLGLRIAVVDPGVGAGVLAARLALAQPRLVLADAAAQAVAGWARPLGRRLALVLPALAGIAPVLTVGPRGPGCAARLEPATACALPPGCASDSADAVVVFTSGTTASPRAVVHTWASLGAGMRAVGDLVRPTTGQVVLGGTFFVMVPALAAGAPVTLPARGARALRRQLRVLHPQATYLTPPVLRTALAAGATFSGRVYTGSAPVTATLLDRLRAAGAAEAWGVYALTELFPVAAVEATEKARFHDAGDLVGAPLPGVRAHTARDGELILTGPAAFDRYLGEPPAVAVHTGDVGGCSGDPARIVLAGRAKDMVLRGALNIYPGLYEPALHVAGVELVVLVGVPAGDGDERLVAVVQPTPGADSARVRAALAGPLAAMGEARPDAVVLADVPVSGRSRKPDRVAASALAVTSLSAGQRR